MKEFGHYPESMKPTKASEHPGVIEANRLVGMEAFKTMEEARQSGEILIYDAAQVFLNGPDYGKRKG